MHYSAIYGSSFIVSSERECFHVIWGLIKSLSPSIPGWALSNFYSAHGNCTFCMLWPQLHAMCYAMLTCQGSQSPDFWYGHLLPVLGHQMSIKVATYLMFCKHIQPPIAWILSSCSCWEVCAPFQPSNAPIGAHISLQRGASKHPALGTLQHLGFRCREAVESLSAPDSTSFVDGHLMGTVAPIEVSP